MILEPPKTLEEFQQVRNSILELMSNQYCDQLMFLSLFDKLSKVDEQISKLQIK